MKIAIIGSGFVGLSAAYKLTKRGYDVTVFESLNHPGGLAAGFSDKKWKWSLEEHYHHWFTSDTCVRDLAKELDFPVSFPRPVTSILYNDALYQLDSPQSLLSFPHLSFVDRLRTGATLFYLKVNPFWKILETITAKDFLIKTMGERSWNVLWKNLFIGKFGKYSNKIPASWFWSRIKKRSSSLGYPDGGFGRFAERIAKEIKKNNGKIKYKSLVTEITKEKNQVKLSVKSLNNKSEIKLKFDKVICTLPTPLFTKITKGLPNEYLSKIKPLHGVGAVTLVLAMKESFFRDGTYWLNVNQKGFPFLAVVEHTNLISRRNYGGDRILYVGNYVPQDHEYFGKSSKELLKLFAPYLKKINSNFDIKMVRKSWKFSAPFAQPIIPMEYSKNILPLKTPIDGLYLANIQQVYPWDRGTNYAVELGYKVAKLVSD